MDQRLQKSIDSLLARDDVWMTRERVEGYLASGEWQTKSFVDYIEKHAADAPDSPAIIDQDGTVTTYGEFNEKANRVALGLLELGVSPGERIAIQLPNRSEFLITLMGAAKASILPVLCHLPYTNKDLDYIMELTDAKALVIPDKVKSRDYVQMALELKASHDCLNHIIVMSEQSHEGTVRLADLLYERADSAEKLEATRPVGTDPFFLMFTSGTTGKPKAEL
ncbi:MAG TPA: AMP-binding protein, partial [Bacillales bacterium]|nr:AMP-binding protein [Bacillales bacterium]